METHYHFAMARGIPETEASLKNLVEVTRIIREQVIRNQSEIKSEIKCRKMLNLN